MAIKSFESRNGLVNKLRSRGLIFDEQELRNTLKKFNYYSLFNGFENLLLCELHPKKYDAVTLKDFEALYEFDKKLSRIIFSYLNKLESALKTSIAYHFAKCYCNTLANTMQYTNKLNYMDPQDDNILSDTYCPYSNNYPFFNDQNKRIYFSFNDFLFFKPFYLSNLINYNDHIDKTFYRSPTYSASRGVAVYRDDDNNYYSDVAVPIWVAIETLSFGEVLRLLHYLKVDVIEGVLDDFNLRISKRFEFLNMLDFLLYLRNCCAHGSLINRFNTPIRYIVNSNIVRSFGLHPQKYLNYKHSKLSLFDVLKILSYFYSLNDIRKLLKHFFYSNNQRMGVRRGNELKEKILNQMGCPRYIEWKSLLSGDILFEL